MQNITGKPVEPRQKSAPSVCGISDTCASTESNMSDESESVNNVINVGNFMYMPVSIYDVKVAALMDTGSSVNIMSNSLFQKLPTHVKCDFQNTSQSVILANNQSVNILGTGRIQIRTPCSSSKHTIFVYILESSSHPLILGTSYFIAHGITLDFGKFVTFSSNMKLQKVRCKTNVTVPPRCEVVLHGKVSRETMFGLPGFCSVHSSLLQKGLTAMKCVVSISSDGTVPIRILNTGSEPVYVKRGSILAKFKPLDNTYSITKVDFDEASCANVNIASENVTSNMCSEKRSEFLKKFKINEELSLEEKESLLKCLADNDSVFVSESNPDIGLTDVAEHRIHLKPNAVSKHHKPYRLPPNKKEALRYQLEELIRQGIITTVHESEDVPITSPIVLVSKKAKPKDLSGELTKEQSLSFYRFCCDFRYLNSQTQDFRYHIPDLQELTESFTERTPNYITSIDLSKGFFQMPISGDSTKYTAFNTCFGTYKFLRLPMGLKTSPNSFQLLMDKVLKGLTFKSVLCYIDDILVASETFSQHLDDLQEVFDRLKAAGLKIEPKKCHFAQRKCMFLGHEISRDGITPPDSKVEYILNLSPPSNQKELRRIMGLFNWFRKFLPNFSAVAQPLMSLLRKGVKFAWQQKQQSAFEKLKELLKNSSALSFPRFDLDFRISVDTSSHGIGYMLYQIHEDGTQKVVRFGSKGLSKWQKSYGPTKLELLGMVTAVLDCAPYIRGRHATIECDHQALKPLFQKQLKGAIYERWLAILQQFDIDIVYKPASEMCVPDALSRNSNFPTVLSSSPEEEDPYFPYVQEKPTTVKLPDGSRLEDLIQTEPKSNFLKVAQFEYDADTEDNMPGHLSLKRHRFSHINKDRHTMKLSRKQCAEVPSQQTSVDSSREDMHSEGIINDATLPPSQSIFNQTTEIDTSRSDNEVATSTFINSESAYNKESTFRDTHFLTENIKRKQRMDSELQPLIVYLESGKLPSSQKIARDVLLKHSDYALIDGMLFHSRSPKSRRARSLTHYQLVVPQDMISDILHLYHDSPVAAHGGIHDTLDKIKEHYFFTKMSSIISDYVRSCQHCQKRKISRMPTKSGITAYPVPSEPFEVWEIDLYGPLPITTKGYTYIFTAVDMFSKYNIGIPIRNKDALTVSNAFFELITTFGVCNTIISDQGSEFIANVTTELCKLLHIAQQFTPAFMHHCLGACERTHATLAERLTPYMSEDKKNWDQMLSPILFSMNCSVNTSLGYSPYEILFGSRPKFPLVNYHSEPTSTVTKDTETYLNAKINKINIIRTEVMENTLKSKNKMVEKANTQLRPLLLQKNDYVFLHKEPTGKAHKLQNNYAGPYVVHSIPSEHTVTLKDPITNKFLENAVHINRLKRAFVREPTPSDFFNVVSTRHITQKHQCSQTDSSAFHGNRDDQQTIMLRPRRDRRPPIRYRDENHLDPHTFVSYTASSDSDGYHKIKKIIGQKQTPGGKQYLIQIAGEPADNAFWVTPSYLNAKAKASVNRNPPPIIQ